MSQGKNTNFDFTKKGDKDCKSKIDVSNPEYLMDLAGTWNKYQFFQTTIFVIVVIFFTYSHYLPILYLYVPEHYCLISGGEKHNLVQEDLNNIFIPRVKNESRYENCLQYDVDVLRILENGIREPNSSWPLVSCQNGWHYEFENYYNSVASEFNFVCENSWKGPLTETVYFVGSSLGMLMYGWIGDYLGRYWTVILSNWFVCLCGMGLGFSNSYVIYTFIRFLKGISTVTTLTSFFVLAMEYVSKSKRTFIGNFSLGLGIAIAGSIMPALFYVLKDWRLVNHAMYAQVSLTFLLPFFIHESVRWLLERGQYNKAGKILEKVAKFNGRTLDKNIILELNSRDNENDDEETKKVTSILELFKTPRLRRHIITMIVFWTLVKVLFETHLRSIKNLEVHVYYSFALSALLEFPADLLIIWTMEMFGRRWMSVITLVLSGIPMLIAVYFEVNEGDALILMVLSMIGRFCCTMVINVVMQFQFEICPTDLRTRGSGLILFVAEFVALLAPLIVFSSSIYSFLPNLIMGVGGVTVGFLALTLPETSGIELPANAKEGEDFGLDQSFFDVPIFRGKS